MARSRETWGKKETAKRKEKKRKDKEKKREERGNLKDTKNPDDMIAYVDEFGNITSTPPEPGEREKVKPEDILIGVPKRDDQEDDNPVKEGIVTYYNETKGYGFIRVLTTNESVFFHVNEVLEPISSDQKVTFETEIRAKGKNALRVKPLK